MRQKGRLKKRQKLSLSPLSLLSIHKQKLFHQWSASKNTKSQSPFNSIPSIDSVLTLPIFYFKVCSHEQVFVYSCYVLLFIIPPQTSIATEHAFTCDSICGDTTLDGSGDMTLDGSGDTTLDGSGDTTLDGSGDTTLAGSSDMTLDCSSDMTLDCSSDMTLAGRSDTTLAGSGDTTLADMALVDITQTLHVTLQLLIKLNSPRTPQITSLLCAMNMSILIRTYY